MLNERQKKFCEFFAQCGNATDAAIKAGYSEKSAGTNADKLLKNTKVSNYLKELGKNTRSEAIADITEIKEMWSKVMRSNDEEMPHRLKASELLVKSSGGFLEKIEHYGKMENKWEIEFVNAEDENK